MLLLLAALACRSKDYPYIDTSPVDSTPPVTDVDGDGWEEHLDCDDSDPDVNPGADEIAYDGLDNDCNESTPDDDLDGDGYEAALDCDDEDDDVFPGATEICNGLDDDCDGEADNAVGDTWHVDGDGDGFGDPEVTETDCDGGGGLVDDDSDCDDDDPQINPGASETCNEIDDDCDGDVDEDAEDASTWNIDYDGDGYGSDAYTVESCDRPEGYVEDGTDCDDGDDGSNPGAEEVCDEADNDCDGDVDEDVEKSWYLDYDGDGYGDDDYEVSDCDRPSSDYVSTGGDCDDSDTAYNPGATAGCDGEDYDCDGSVDNDADGDGYADASCGGDDCDDADTSVSLCGSCDEILSVAPSSTDGVYSIDPDGAGSFDAWCDMSTDGGGWTLCFAYDTSSYDSSEWSSVSVARDKLLAEEWGDTDLSGDSTTQGNFCNLMPVTAGTTELIGEVVQVSDSTVLTSGTYLLDDEDFFTQIHDDGALEFDCLVDDSGGRRLLFANYNQPANIYNYTALHACSGTASSHSKNNATAYSGDWGVDGLLIMSADPSGSDYTTELSLHVNWYSTTSSQALYTNSSDASVTKFGVTGSWVSNGYGRTGQSPGPNYCYTYCGYTNVANAEFKQRLWVR
ncbi:MAG TPA: MopE-related protein [Myxococcota bacterium]|nr:MopE-related protein [Myxococcota bacterium]